MPGASVGGDGTAPLRQLLALQDADTLADQLAYRRRHLPEQAALDLVQSRLGEMDRARSIVAAERAELSVREGELESETATLVARSAAIDERSRSGSAGSYRDQQAMAAEIETLDRRRAELEEVELGVLEAAEPLDVELARIDAERAPLDAERVVLEQDVSAATASLEVEMAETAARRAPLAAGVPAPLLAEYETLRSRLGGVGVARLVRGACEGCHLALPATEVDRLHRAAAGEVAHCEQCGRILVP